MKHPLEVLSGERSRLGGLRRESIYLHNDQEDNEELLDVLKSLFDRDSIILLDPELSQLGSQALSIDKVQARSLITAIGATERLMSMFIPKLPRGCDYVTLFDG